MKITCPYVGTYILFSQVHDAQEQLATVSSPTLSNQPQSDSAQIVLLSHQFYQVQCSSGRPPTRHQRHGLPQLDMEISDYDSDDSQVKKKIKVAALEWQGELRR